MEPVRLWAAVEFTARSGSTEALLTAAARGRAASLRRDGSARGVLRPLCRPAVSAPCCSGSQIPGTAAGAQKAGAVLPGAPVAAPGRLWAGLAVFLPLLLWTQQFVWFADVSTLTAGQAARRLPSCERQAWQPGSA